MTLSELSNLRKDIQGIDDSIDKVKYSAIILIITNVENSLNIHLSEDERNSLAKDLYNLNEPITKIRERAESVKRAQTTYGKIGFNVWINAQRLYTEEEIDRLVEEKIEQRKNDFIKKSKELPSEEQLSKEGFIAAEYYYFKLYQEEKQKHAERWKKNIKQMKSQYYHLPEDSKKRLWRKAVEMGIVADNDPFAYQILPLLIPKMYQEFKQEIYMFNNKKVNNENSVS